VSSIATVAEFWGELVTTSLLGTDRREPPSPPAGPLRDVVDDATRPTPSGRMLAATGACVAARRAGFTPLAPAPAPSLARPPHDDRPMLPSAAAHRWRVVVAHWPLLEDEWLDLVERGGWRLAPDVLVDLLRRHRIDAGRRGRIATLGGPLAAWLVDLCPELAGRATGRATAHRRELPISPALAPLLDEDVEAVCQTLVAGFAGGLFGSPHRAVLVNLVARLRPEVLGPLATALRAADATAGGVGLAISLADLASTRDQMIAELTGASAHG